MCGLGHLSRSLQRALNSEASTVRGTANINVQQAKFEFVPECRKNNSERLDTLLQAKK